MSVFEHLSSKTTSKRLSHRLKTFSRRHFLWMNHLGRTLTCLLGSLILGLMSLGCGNQIRGKNEADEDILSLMRDWRGVWRGTVETSPIGTFDYTLFIQPKSRSLLIQMAEPPGAPEDIQTDFVLMNFDGGHPKIRARLIFRGKTTLRDYVFSQVRSDEETACFCLDGRGCRFGEIRFSKVRGGTVKIHVLKEETTFAAIRLRFDQRNIPLAPAKADRMEVVRSKDTRVRDGTLAITVEPTPVPREKPSHQRPQNN